MAKTKICTKCRTKYPATIEYFPPCGHTLDKLQSWCRNCTRILQRRLNKKRQQTKKGKEQHRQNSVLYRQRHPERVKELAKRHYETHKQKHLKEMRQYRNTPEGYLRHIYSDIKRRCSGNSKNPKDAVYIKRHIQNKFQSSDEFVDYVINKLQIDSRGLQIHRLNSDGHYEKGNIVFLTKKEHQEIHRKRHSAYVGHSIRGFAGKKATDNIMKQNCERVSLFMKKLRKCCPVYAFYVPGEVDEFISLAYRKRILSEKEILKVDCLILRQRDILIAYTSADEPFISRGMKIEIKYAKEHAIPVCFINDRMSCWKMKRIIYEAIKTTQEKK